jgi:L-amino acid N-acyltransferase YncA
MTGELDKNMFIRNVEDRDMSAITEIYAVEVRNGVSSWEEEPPSLEEMIKRRDAIINSGYPYRVAVRDEIVMGYAYVSAYRPRPAYRHTVENSIYIADHGQRMGLGEYLLNDLVSICTDMGFRQMIAVVGDSENARSINFHIKMGFEKIGIIKSIGFKFGRWLDSVVLQLPLGDGNTTPPSQ